MSYHHFIFLSPFFDIFIIYESRLDVWKKTLNYAVKQIIVFVFCDVTIYNFDTIRIYGTKTKIHEKYVVEIENWVKNFEENTNLNG